MNEWLVFGASARGPAHEQEHTPCQDAWARGPFGAHGTCLCLCDGAGSAAHAEAGARVVATAMVAALRDATDTNPEGLTAALHAACTAGRAALLREAEALEVAPSALSCTLVAVVCTGDLVAVAHLGDGAVVGQRADADDLVVLSAPDRGEYARGLPRSSSR